jgi:L-ascorbate metabolism protein UlaG (beta-lactamase superfamily)
MKLTWLDANSWLIEMAGTRVLLDPWLVGPFFFGNLTWLFKGSRTQNRPIPEKIDLILLSQGLEDHAHPETLRTLDKNWPIVASPNAGKVAKEYGYTQITSLEPGQHYTFKTLEITAFPGSPLGPFLTENAYLLKDLTTGTTLYYEPHGNHAQQLTEIAPIDVVITPLIDQTLPLVGPIIKGRQSALDLAKMVQPKVMLPTAAGGDVIFEGLLTSMIKMQGSLEEIREGLSQNHLSTQVIDPVPGQEIEMSEWLMANR